MKAVRVHELGAPEVLRYEDIADAKAGEGEALVRIAAAGVNYLDVYYRSGFNWGGHQRPESRRPRRLRNFERQRVVRGVLLCACVASIQAP
jgi:NADPH:quinone reductase-like Zn-dependent oxidoreductase